MADLPGPGRRFCSIETEIFDNLGLGIELLFGTTSVFEKFEFIEIRQKEEQIC